jgi:spermidine synthase
MRHKYLLGLLVFSGFAGLAYELLWVRLLGLALGSTTLSFATVLAVFFAGLAIGSRWAGRKTATSQRPIATYALLEAITGVIGLLLIPVLQNLGGLIAIIDPGQGAGALVVRFVIAAIFLLPPTFLMGATLPFLCLGTIEDDASSGEGSALIYGFNTLGACLGAYGVTFWLLPLLGITKSTLFVVAINFAVAGIAFAMSKRPHGDGPASAPAESAPISVAGNLKINLAFLSTFIGGFVATGAQIIWARIYTIALKGTSYGIGSVLVSVLIGIALGSLVASRLAKSRQHISTWAALSQFGVILGLAVFSALLPVFLYAAGSVSNSPTLKGTAAYHVQGLIVWATLALATISSGALLPLLVATIENAARNVGSTLSKLYAVNTAGCIAGSLAIGFFALPALGSPTTLYLLVVLAVLSISLFSLAHLRENKLVAVPIILASLGVAGFFPNFEAQSVRTSIGSRADYFSNQAQLEQASKSVTYFHEGDIATVTLTGNGNDTVYGLALNGLGQGGRSLQPPEIIWESALVAAVPLVHHASPKRGLVVGLGAAGTVRALLDLGVEKLEVCELEKGVVEAVDKIWGDRNPLKDSRATLVLNDARLHLQAQARKAPESYDFVTSMPAHPWVASSLFTVDFFNIVRSNLTDDGIFSAWFGPGQMSQVSLQALFGAISTAFPHYIVYWVPETSAFYIVAGKKPVALRGERIAAVFHANMFRAEPPARKTPEFLLARVVASSPEVTTPLSPVASDDNAIIEFDEQKSTPLTVDKMDFFPQRFLPANRYESKQAETDWLATIETQLGTARGRLPSPPNLKSTGARRVFPSVETAFPELFKYVTARALLLDGKRDEAQKLSATIQDPMMKKRMAAFLAENAPDKSVQLKTLEVGGDVLAARLVTGEVFEPGVPLPDMSDPLAWFFVQTSLWPAVTPSDRGVRTKEMIDRLRAFNSEKLFDLCATQAKKAGYFDLENMCQTLAPQARSANGLGILRRGISLGEKGDWKGALKLIREAHAIVPISDERVKLWMRTALKVGSPDDVARCEEILRGRGHAFETVEFWKADAVRRNREEKE